MNKIIHLSVSYVQYNTKEIIFNRKGDVKIFSRNFVCVVLMRGRGKIFFEFIQSCVLILPLIRAVYKKPEPLAS